MGLEALDLCIKNFGIGQAVRGSAKKYLTAKAAGQKVWEPLVLRLSR